MLSLLLCSVTYSQVPQPTCYWKWVGVSIPQKVGNFSLRPSTTAIWQQSRLRGCLLGSYGSWLSLTPTLNFHISPSAAVAGHSCHPPNPHFVTTVKLASSRNENWEGDMFGRLAQQPWHFENFSLLICFCETCTRSIYPHMCNFFPGSAIVFQFPTFWGIGNPTDFQVSWRTWLVNEELCITVLFFRVC